MATECICVWYDAASAEKPAWIVSRDDLDEDGGREGDAHTLAVCDDEGEALQAAKEHGRKPGLPVYRNPERGRPELTRDADES